MKLLLCALSVVCLVAVISAKKAIEENLDPIEPETREHSSKKYTKDYQKPHHHSGHKHKKHPVAEEPAKASAVDPKPKDTPVEIPEPEVRLQSDLGTSKKAIKEDKRRSDTEDLHLQDLAYEESLKKDKKKKTHHHAEAAKPKSKGDHRLFAEQDASKTPDEMVIEDSFQPLKESHKGKGKDKKPKDKSKKKASEKTKGKKSKEGKGKKDKNKKSKEGKRKW